MKQDELKELFDQMFNMQPENAIEFLKQKKVVVSWDWQDMLDDAHVSAFTVAKTAGMDVANDIHQAVIKAAQTGQTFEDFERELRPILERKGWWGKKEGNKPRYWRSANGYIRNFASSENNLFNGFTKRIYGSSIRGNGCRQRYAPLLAICRY